MTIGPAMSSGSVALPRWLELVVIAALGSIVALTALGRYPFWEDEADTILYAQSVWNTGDMTAWAGHNLYAFRNGMCLDGYKHRFAPPLSFYLVAPFWGAFGADHFWLRLPFALCGIASLATFLALLARHGVERFTWWLTALGMLLNVSFWLYARQCRYYQLSVLLSLLVVWTYLHWEDRRSRYVAFGLASIVLAANHYLSFFALFGALGVDYLVWRRRELNLRPRQLACLVGPVGLAVVAMLLVWNPVGRYLPEHWPKGNLWLEKLTLVWWNLRDGNRCEFWPLPLLVAAPVVAWCRHDRLLARGFVAWLVYTLAATVVSPQPVGVTFEADVRYLIVTIPLGWLVAVRTLRVAFPHGRWCVVAVVFLAALSNVIHLPWRPANWRSTPWLFVQELVTPRRTALEVASAWVREHVPDDATIWAAPGEMMYPLMVDAPQAIYAWQLDPSRQADYPDLPRILFIGQEPVDFIIAYGEADRRLAQPRIAYQQQQGVSYQRTVLDVFAYPGIRPELMLHLFRDPVDFDRSRDAVYVYTRQRP